MNSEIRSRSRLAAAVLSVAGAVVLVACAGTGDPKVKGQVDSAAAAQRPAAVPVMPRQLDALPPRTGAVVSSITVRRDTSSFSTGRAVVTLSTGDTMVVADSAFRAWKLNRALVAVSGLDGAGGYENEGQSLTVIDVATGRRRQVVSDYFQIVRVEAVTVNGQIALLVHMRDGGQGGLHVTIVDPQRGVVFRALHALGRIDGGLVLVSGFGDGETPVDFGDTRVPLRVDSVSVATVSTRSLLVVPRAGPT